MTNITSTSLTHKKMPMQRNRNLVRATTVTGFGPITNVIVLAVLLLSIGVVYLTQVTKTNAYGYQLDGLRTRKVELQNRNNQLKIDIAKAQSLEAIENSAVSANLVDEPKSTTYLSE